MGAEINAFVEKAMNTEEMKEKIEAAAKGLADRIINRAVEIVQGSPFAATNGAVAEVPRATTKAPKAEKPSGRLPRRSAEEITALAGKVATLLKSHPSGLRAEDIRIAMGWDQREVPRVLQQGVNEKLFKVIWGQKRSTTYGLPGSKPAGKTVKKASKVASKAKKPKK